ncbi:MAG TPA: class I mannose-6-phosphate isomerase [Bryobacteraceae bacterium]|nr:class I mannose-6-phosphate isomerase [Bryobacteraceae bacterium]
MSDPVLLTPSLREKVWGKTRLAPWFPDSETPIGEAWFISEQELPLLVKLIFTSERLSVQVHPDDGEAGPRGKTEMWHILAAERDAFIALGFREVITHERLLEAARSGEIEKLLNWFRVKPGQTYFVPAHTVHAIGAGIVLCEIQQNCDVTYRLWDYGRPREIHVDQAVPISELAFHRGVAPTFPMGPGRELLVNCKHFHTEMVKFSQGSTVVCRPKNCDLWICLEGYGTISGHAFHPGEVWHVPDDEALSIRAMSASRLIRTYVPD